MFPTPEILARLNGLVAEVAHWGPAVPVALVFAVALIEAALLPRRLWARGVWLLVVVACGGGALALLHWEQRTKFSDAESQAASETAALYKLWSQWDALSKTLPPRTDGKEPAASFDTVDAALAALKAKVAGISDQITALKTGAVGRSIDAETAVKLADYLRPIGSHRVIVSCAPGDLEAYNYANQLVGVLKAAGWDAGGPEATVNVVDQPAMGVSVLLRDPSSPDAAKILLDAFTQFNIAHQPGIAADYAIPDTATVELFVARKP